MMNINFNSVLNTLASKAKALALNVSEIELKVLEATNEEPWGPHGKDMAEIARAAEDPEKYNLIMNVLSERLQMRDENWRLCYKALLLLEFMVKHGPWRVVDELNRSVSSLERLRDEFEYKDPQGRDQGINVRQRAGELAALVCNMDRVRQEREKAARNASKFKGVSSSDVRGGFGSTNYSAGGNYGYSGFGSGGGGGGGGRSQGYGGTESVHVPGSHHNRTGSASNYSAGSNAGTAGRREEGFRSIGGGGGAGEDAEDPFEATRKRIERLKAEGALQESGAAAAPPGLVDPAASAKAPKKLSDVKINPAVAATFANIGIPNSSSTGSLGKLAPPPSSGASVKPIPAQQSGDTSLDLFGERSLDPVPAAQQPSASSSSALDWDAAFGGAAPSGSSGALGASGSGGATVAAAAAIAAAPGDPFAAFELTVATATAAPAAPSTDFGSMFGGGPAASAPSAPAVASARPPVRPPLPLDDFAELGDPSPAPGPSFVQQSLTTFTAISATPPAADPFAALASSSSATAPAPPMLAARPASSAAVPAGADPFAALSAARAAPTPPAALLPKPPAGAVAAPLPFDAFATAAPPPPARTPQPVASADPFAALASSSAPAPVPMSVAAARPPPQPAAAAAPFDPFSSAPAPVSARPAAAAAAPVFDAFGSTVAPPAPAAAAAGFDDFFGASSSGQNGQYVAATQPTAGSDLFAASPFPAFPPPPAAAAPAASAAAANGVAGMAMNKSGAAHGAGGHKNSDPFAGLGF